MDDYKLKVIELVRERSLLWDPQQKDYKNKEQRQQMWNEIGERLVAPTGANVNAKDTWEQLSRCFSNALKRKEKRSGSGASTDKQWKYEQNMMFLLPVKQDRLTSGNLPDMNHCQGTFVIGSLEENSHVGGESQDEGRGRHGENEDEDSHPGGQNEGSRPEESLRQEEVPSQSRQAERRKRKDESDEDLKTVLSLIKERDSQRREDSPRLNFFRSLMDIVDTFSPIQFLNLQAEVIQCVQRINNQRHSQDMAVSNSDPFSEIKTHHTS